MKWLNMMDCWSHKVTSGIECFFYRLGVLIGHHPWKTLMGSLALSLLCSGGLLLWRQVTDDEFLWTPYGSPIVGQKQWIDANFPKDTRYQSVILQSENVFSSAVISFLKTVNDTVSSIHSDDYNNTFQDLCLRDWKSGKCVVASVLAFWDSNPAAVGNLTDKDVVNVLSLLLNPSFPFYKDLIQLFSGIRYQPGTKKVIGADAMMAHWLLRQSHGTHDAGGKTIDPVAMAWEEKFIQHLSLLNQSSELKMFYLAEKSFDDGIDGAVNENLQILFAGFALILVYTGAVLGRGNVLQQRVVLSLAGLVVIGLALAASFGFCFYLGIFFADMHPVIPFLLLGIGVDDMFVIVQGIDNLKRDHEKQLDVAERIGLALKHSGLSITVTSFTDMAAFFIGSTTSMPILRAFCLFAGFGVLFLYLLAVTFFVGCLALDERRLDDRKVVCGSCIPPKSDQWRPHSCSQTDYMRMFFEKFVGPSVTCIPVKLAVIGVATTLFGFGVFGICQMETNYDSVWYMAKNSYQTQFYTAMSKFFPSQGERAEIFVGRIDYWRFMAELEEIEAVLRQSPFVNNASISFWFPPFYRSKCSANAQFNCSEESGFKAALRSYLCSYQHSYWADFRTDTSFTDICLGSNFTILATRVKYQHHLLSHTQIKNRAMDEIRQGLSRILFTGESFSSPIAYSFIYVQWEANKVISTELIRNLSLTFGTITIISLVLVPNLQTCFFTLLSVVLTVVDVWGFAYYLGLSIEIVTSIILILSVGLALDYAVHVAVMFNCQPGISDRNQKTRSTLTMIGPAVFHGGFSTFLAFVLLAGSESYVFSTFFQMFALVVLFGLFHGLILLPVWLSLLGPVSAAKPS